jgi:hypothetical protein
MLYKHVQLPMSVVALRVMCKVSVVFHKSPSSFKVFFKDTNPTLFNAYQLFTYIFVILANFYTMHPEAKLHRGRGGRPTPRNFFCDIGGI